MPRRSIFRVVRFFCSPVGLFSALLTLALPLAAKACSASDAKQLAADNYAAGQQGTITEISDFHMAQTDHGFVCVAFLYFEGGSWQLQEYIPLKNGHFGIKTLEMGQADLSQEHP
jgi:hypothetical protein